MHPAVEETVKRIKSLEIQGASKVAERAVAAIYTLLSDMEGRDKEEIKKEVLEAIKVLARSRPTEPALRESLAFILRNMIEVSDLPGDIFRTALMERIDRYIDKRESIKEQIATFGKNLIEDGFTIITHCHSSTLMKIFRKAAEEGKQFTVIVTETRPRLQGLKTAKELLEMGVKVKYIVDGAANYFMKEVDLYMTGADVITADGKIINKVGTSLIALSAREFGVPYYVAASSYKFDPVTVLGLREPIEERDPREVIDPEEIPGAEIRNPAFDVTPAHLVTGIVSEIGVLSPHSFISVVSSRRSVDPSLEEIVKMSL